MFFSFSFSLFVSALIRCHRWNANAICIIRQTERLKYEIRTKVLMSDLEDILDRPTFNQTALRILLDNVRSVRENTTRAVSSLETVLYLIRPPDQGDTLKQMLGVSMVISVALSFEYRLNGCLSRNPFPAWICSCKFHSSKYCKWHDKMNVYDAH